MNLPNFCRHSFSLCISAVFFLSLHAPSRAESVRLYRDTYGVPHIFAESRASAYFGAGYAVAEDLGWGLSQLALKAEGRQAEFFGRQDGLLEEDIYARHFHFYKDALEQFDRLSPEVREAFAAYCEGIAARYGELAESQERPDWAIAVTPEHLAANFLAANFYQSAFEARDHELKDMGIALPYPFLGSNAFAIGPEKTSGGATVHFAGPQTPFGDSQAEIHLEWPGGRVAGYGYGLFMDPGIGLNHAWGATANWPDTSDVWKLKLDPTREGFYWDPLENGGQGGWLEMDRLQFTLRVLGEARPRSYRRWQTRLGPVLWIDEKYDENLGEVLSLDAYVWRPSGWGRIEYIEAVMRKQWAPSLRQAMSAADPPEVVSGNWIMADRNGDIGFLYTGRIPGRQSDEESHAIRPSQNGPREWADWLYTLGGARALPAILNPASGFLVSANEAPWFVSTTGEIAGRGAWPPYVVPTSGWGSAATVRGERLRSLIGGFERMSPEVAASFGFDLKVPKALAWVSACQAALQAASRQDALSPGAARISQILAEWDGMASVDSEGMTAAWHLVHAMKPWGDPAEAARAGAIDPTAIDPLEYARALESVASTLNRNYGRLDVPWGEMHGLARDGQWIPLPGGTDLLPAVFQAHGRHTGFIDTIGGDGRIRCTDGSVHLAFTAFLPGGAVERFTISPFGQHNPHVHPASPHCSDQIALYAAGRYKPFWLAEQDVQANLTTHEGEPGYIWKARKTLEWGGAGEPREETSEQPEISG